MTKTDTNTKYCASGGNTRTKMMSGLNSGIALELLKVPFPPEKIHWRVGATNAKSNGGKASKGIALAYIDARDVMERLDDVIGAENWQCRYPFQGCCELGIKVNGEWLWKSNGAGETDVEGEKGQYSDAFKRAAVLWGIGQYLYALPNVWVDVDEWGRIKNPPVLPDWAIPSGDVDREKLKDALIAAVAVCDGDDMDNGPDEARKVFDPLTNAERIELGAILKKFAVRNGNREKGYHTIFREYLTYKPEQVA